MTVGHYFCGESVDTMTTDGGAESRAEHRRILADEGGYVASLVKRGKGAPPEVALRGSMPSRAWC